MTDEEFRMAVFDALETPVTPEEEHDFGVQCLEDYDRVYMDRIRRLISRSMRDDIREWIGLYAKSEIRPPTWVWMPGDPPGGRALDERGYGGAVDDWLKERERRHARGS